MTLKTPKTMNVIHLHFHIYGSEQHRPDSSNQSSGKLTEECLRQKLDFLSACKRLGSESRSKHCCQHQNYTSDCPVGFSENRSTDEIKQSEVCQICQHYYRCILVASL